MEFVTEYLLPRLGPGLNFVGSVLVAVSFGRHLAGAHNVDAHGRKVYLASFLHPLLFRIGLGLMASGFLIEMVKPR